MFDFLKKRLICAEVDGIKFYREKTLQNYLDRKNRMEFLNKSRVGKNLYTFKIPWYQKYNILSKAINILESNGCFDYEIDENIDIHFIILKYWSKNLILDWKD